MRFSLGLALVVSHLFVSSIACNSKPDPVPPQANTPANLPPSGNGSGYVPVAKYDPGRSAETDLQQAMVEARRTGKRILLEVGGEWCVWCHIMDAYFEEHPALLEYREQKFVTVKINYSEENENTPFLSRYPKISGYPHIFVLESDGRFLHSQGTGDLESGKSYDLDKFSGFLHKWAS